MPIKSLCLAGIAGCGFGKQREEARSVGERASYGNGSTGALRGSRGRGADDRFYGWGS